LIHFIDSLNGKQTGRGGSFLSHHPLGRNES
jgi:hypothetical protein